MATTAAARRYAKALFQLAREQGNIDGIRSELRGLHSALEASPELRDVLLQPIHPAGERRKVLEAISEQLQASPILRSFYSFLIDQRRLVDFESIESEYERLADEAAGLVIAKVSAAQDLSEDQKSRLQRALSARTGQTVQLQVEVEPSRLGGVVAQVGDLVFDGSLKTQLDHLRTNLGR